VNNSRHEKSSSTAIEELLDHTEEQDQYAWLLSYLDVFVLMLMLAITLMSITDIIKDHSEQPGSEHTQTIAQTKLTQIATKELTDIKTTAPENIAIIHNEVNKEINKAQQISIITEEVNTEPELPNQPSVERIDAKNNTSAQTQKAEKQWQDQFKHQLETIGIDEAISLQFKNSSIHIEIQDNILFNSAEAVLTLKGEQALLPLSKLLAKSTGMIYIEGHTDNRPIHNEDFPSNWELGAERALSVLHFLIKQHILPTRLRATSYADTQPISSNKTKVGRQKNRRVNLIIKMPPIVTH